MPAYLHDRVYDNGLTVLDTEADKLFICSSQPSTFSGAVTAKLGEKTLGTGDIGAPGARTGGGRKVTMAAVTTGGSVTANGTASHWAFVDTANSRLLAAGPLSATQAFTAGNTFTTAAFDVEMPPPA